MSDSGPLIAHNVIKGNTAGNGAAITCGSYASAEIRNNVILENAAAALGGAIYLYNNKASVVNNTFVGNNAPEGAAIFCVPGSEVLLEPSIVNNIIAGNVNGPAVDTKDEGTEVLNVRYNNFWDNEDGDYSHQEAWCDQNSVGNMFVDPCFVDSINLDFHLLPLSPCIDGGDPESAYANEPWPNGGRTNIGAYGNTPEAAKTTYECYVLSPDEGWVVEYGSVDGSGFRWTFEEDAGSLSSTLARNVMLTSRAAYLVFDVTMANAEDPSGTDDSAWSDAFTASIVDPNTGVPLLGTADNPDFFFCDNNDSTETIAIIVGKTVILDVSRVAGRNALLAFDLWSDADGISTTVQLSGIRIRCTGALAEDFNADGRIGLPDFSLFALKWLEDGCVAPDWCNYADLNESGEVSFEDFVLFAEYWLE